MPPQGKDLRLLTDQQFARLLGAAWDLNAATLLLMRAGLIEDGKPIDVGALFSRLQAEAVRRDSSDSQQQVAVAGYVQ